MFFNYSKGHENLDQFVRNINKETNNNNNKKTKKRKRIPTCH